jgi:prepilin-type processing-associated H-X9-DG protein
MEMDTSGGFSEELEDVFAAQPEDPEMRESVNAWIWDGTAELGLPRVGVEAVADQWDTHDVQVNIAFADGRVFNIFGPGPLHDPFGTGDRPRTLGAGPLSFEVLEPYRHLRMRAVGEAVATSVTAQMDGALPGQGVPSTPVEILIDLYPAVPPFMNGALLDDARRVLETQDEGGLMGYPWRFEQLCRASGSVQIGVERFTIDGGANRIRRQSIRRLATLRGHAWQAALFPSGRGFGYIAYPPRADGKDTYNEGYVFEGDGALVPARVVQAPWLRALTPKGDDATCVLETSTGTVTVHGETALSTFMIMPTDVGGGGMQLQQAIVRYSWDGEESVGMLERSTVAAGLT